MTHHSSVNKPTIWPRPLSVKHRSPKYITLTSLCIQELLQICLPVSSAYNDDSLITLMKHERTPSIHENLGNSNLLQTHFLSFFFFLQQISQVCIIWCLLPRQEAQTGKCLSSRFLISVLVIPDVSGQLFLQPS